MPQERSLGLSRRFGMTAAVVSANIRRRRKMRIPQEENHGRSAFRADDRRAGRHRPRPDVLDDAGRHGRRRDPRRPHQGACHGSPGRSEIRRAQQEPPLGLGRPAEEGRRRGRAAPDREGRRHHRAVPPRRRRAAGPGARRPPRAQSQAGLWPHDRLGPGRPARQGGRPRHQLHRADRRAAVRSASRTSRRRRSTWSATSAAAACFWPSAWSVAFWRHSARARAR